MEIMKEKAKIDGRTGVLGIIGMPVEHTLSPLIHNTLAEDLHHPLVYVPFPVALRDRLGDAVKGAFALGVQGLNVTVPYKKTVIPHLEGLDPLAEKIGAVNTLVRGRSGYIGHNTDILGLERALELRGIILRGRAVILIGAGGAARAAGYLCADRQVRRLYILNRTPEKAIALKEDILASYPGCHITAGALSAAAEIPEKSAAAIQCTSVGLFPGVNETPVDSSHFFDKLEFAMDLVYNPEETAFLRRVRQHGGQTENGLQMLLWQAVRSYELWTGSRISDEEARRVGELLGASLRGKQHG